MPVLGGVPAPACETGTSRCVAGAPGAHARGLCVTNEVLQKRTEERRDVRGATLGLSPLSTPYLKGQG